MGLVVCLSVIYLHTHSLTGTLSLIRTWEVCIFFFMIHVFASVQALSLSLPLSLLPPLSLSLLPGRPLQACCSLLQRGAAWRQWRLERILGWSGKKKKNGEKIARWVRRAFLSLFNPLLPITFVSMMCARVFTIIASLTPLLLCNTFYATSGVRSSDEPVCCRENRRKSGTCQAVALSSERAQLLPSASLCINLTPGLFVRLSHYGGAHCSPYDDIWVMPLVHTHMICCVWLIHVQCRYEDRWCLFKGWMCQCLLSRR